MRVAQIEHALFLMPRDLFSLRVDLVFYDLTSTPRAKPLCSDKPTRILPRKPQRCGGGGPPTGRSRGLAGTNLAAFYHILVSATLCAQ